MTTLRKLGAVFASLGALLLATYALPVAYGTVMSHVVVALFRAQSPANRMWDSARIRAYRETLKIPFASPEAILRIPRAHLEVPILEGTSELVLNRGAGHIPNTALPGQPGNLAVAGHRDGFFRGLKDLSRGDLIAVERPDRHTDTYSVSRIQIVSPADTTVLRQTAGRTLTLVTCYPFYFVGPAPQRYIVQAELVPETQTASTTAKL